MSALQMVCLVIGTLAIFNVVIVLIVQRFVLRETGEDTLSAQSAYASPGVSAFPPNEAKPLTPEEMSEIYTQMKVSGGYKPKPPPEAD